LKQIALYAILGLAQASAAVTFITNQTTFTNSLVAGYSSGNLDALTAGKDANNLISLGSGNFTFNVSNQTSATNGIFVYATGANHQIGIESQTNGGSNNDFLLFNSIGSTVRAFGANFYFADVAGNNVAGVNANGAGTITVVANGATSTFTIGPNTTVNTFVGIYSTTAITSITFNRTSGNGTGTPIFDNYLDGLSTPEPGSLVLIGSGLAGLLLSRRKR
jgi:hypothetical protein